MHPQAADFIQRTIFELKIGNASPVLNIGGRNVNGDGTSVFPDAPIVLDIHPDPEVNIVADAADWHPDQPYAVVLCTEVFEHTARWREIISTAYRALLPFGYLIATCARDERPPHSALDGASLRDGEFYSNISAVDLENELKLSDWREWRVYSEDGVFGNDDLYCWAQK